MSNKRVKFADDDKLIKLTDIIISEAKKQNLIFTKGPFIDLNCSICLNELTQDNIVLLEKCGHCVCNDCIDPLRNLRTMTQGGVSCLCPKCNKNGGRQLWINGNGNNFKIQSVNELNQSPQIQQLPQLTQLQRQFTGYHIHDNNIHQNMEIILSLPIQQDNSFGTNNTNNTNIGIKIDFIDITQDGDNLIDITNVENNENHNAVCFIEVSNNSLNTVGKDIILLLDISGSMEGFKFQKMKDSFIQIIKTLSEKDRATIVTFSSYARQLFSLESASETNKNKWINLLNNTHPCGGTSYTSGIDKVCDIIEHSKTTGIDRECHLLIAGDGDGELYQVSIDRLNTLDCIKYGLSIGDDVKAELFENILLGDFINGNYAHFGFDNDPFEKVQEMGFLNKTGIKNLEIKIIGGKPDSSLNLLDIETQINKIKFEHFSEGTFRFPIKYIIKDIFNVSATYDINIDDIITKKNIDIEFTNGNKKILKQWLLFRRDFITINNMNVYDELELFKASITEEKYGIDHTKLLDLINMKQIQIRNRNDVNSQNYITETAIRFGSVNSLGRTRSGF
jgi:hypothetical protein